MCFFPLVAKILIVVSLSCSASRLGLGHKGEMWIPTSNNEKIIKSAQC